MKNIRRLKWNTRQRANSDVKRGRFSLAQINTLAAINSEWRSYDWHEMSFHVAGSPMIDAYEGPETPAFSPAYS